MVIVLAMVHAGRSSPPAAPPSSQTPSGSSTESPGNSFTAYGLAGDPGSVPCISVGPPRPSRPSLRPSALVRPVTVLVSGSPFNGSGGLPTDVGPHGGGALSAPADGGPCAGPFPSRLPILRCGQPFRRAGGRRARRRCRSSVRLSACRPARRRLLPSPRVAGQGLRCGHACPAPLQSLPQGPPALLRPARCPPPSWGRAWPFGPSLAQGVCPLAPAVGQHRTLGFGAAQPLRPNTFGFRARARTGP